MNLLIHLISRILAGEAYEKASRRDTVLWCSILALLPAQVCLLILTIKWLESSFGYGLDSYLNVLLFVVLIAVIIGTSITVACRMFYKAPLWLIPLGLGSWGGVAWYAIHR